MQQYTKTIIVVLAVVLGLFLILRFTGGYFLASISPNVETVGKNINQSGKASVGQEAPYFDLVSLVGGHVKRADIVGTPLVLTFWTTWNTESVDQMKILDDYLAQSASNDARTRARILMIDSQESQSAVSNFMRRGGYAVEVLADQSGEVSNSYGIQTLPTTFFIDGTGVIREIFVGTLSQAMLVDKIEHIL